MLITLEGMDGVGKDTVALALSQHLQTCGYDQTNIVILNEPSKDRFGSIVRETLLKEESDYDDMTRFLMMLAARSDNIIKNIIPLITEYGMVVICTRSSLSSIVYQLPNVPSIYHNGLIRGIQTIDSLLTANSIVEYKVVLDCKLETCIDRMNARGTLDAFEAVPTEELELRKKLYIEKGREYGYSIVSNDGDIKDTVIEIMGVIENGQL